ncbi:MAG: family oxidoreductase [Phenylobacterium sp.]|nr:family oxidoreductase [Phenylobacterium sp.]
MGALEALAGRVYAITGASKGMGLRFARALADEGAKVVLLARPSPELEAAGREIEGALAIPCDIGRADQVRAAFQEIGARHGQLHGLVNNAAACLLHKIEESTDEEIRAEIDANLAGPIYCIRDAIPLLREAGGGDIVNVSSESVRLPFPYLTLYAATKAALENLSTGLRTELQPDRIRVTVLRSGQVSGSSLGAGWDPQRMEAFYAAVQASGQASVATAAVSPETMAAMLVQMLRLPREANLDFVELRAFA